MKIIFLSIEFSIGTFSGNGIYAISQVRALRQLGHHVLVICGRPASTANATADSSELLSIPLPVWSRLDLQCSWKEFALGCGAPYIVNSCAKFEADVMLGVDWHSYPAYQNLSQALEAELCCCTQIPPYACSNYRVYLRSVSDEKEREIIRKLEGESVTRGICCTVLSKSDEKFVEENYYNRNYSSNFDRNSIGSRNLGGGGINTSGDGSRCLLEEPESSGEAGQLNSQPPPLPPLHVILPALRADLAALPLPHYADHEKQRKYLLCCVRASPEKEPHRFINLICELQRRNFFEKHGIIPLLVGAGWKVEIRPSGISSINNKTTTCTGLLLSQMPLNEYVSSLRQQVEREVPCCHVIETFLGPTEMAEIYSQTVLNIHPPAYDAYGMTICEAASQMAPSLVAHMGHVGATDLLSPDREEVFVTDMEDTVETLADVVENLLENREKLSLVGKKAAAVARAWNEEANAAALVGVLKDALADSLLLVNIKTSIPKARGVLPLPEPEKPLDPFEKVSVRRGGIDVLVPPRSTLNYDCSNSSDGGINSLLISSYENFEKNYLAANVPVIFSGIAKSWNSTKNWVDASTGKINIEKLEEHFGECRVVATDAACRHRGEGPCKEMSLAEYCQWWKKRHQKQGKEKEYVDCVDDREDTSKEEEEEEEQLWYLKDWHFVKDASLLRIQQQRKNEAVLDVEEDDEISHENSKFDDVHCYQLPMYFADDWLNEWYDSLSTSTAVAERDSTSNSTCSTPLPPLPKSSDYRFLYLGPQGSSTPLHTDVLRSHSWSANIAGRKLWRLLPAQYAHLVQDKSTGMSHPYDFFPEEEFINFDKASIDTTTQSIKSNSKSKTENTTIKARFPGLEQAQHHILEIIQYPGEVIFVPSGWFHTVLNLDDCLSINHNWISSHSAMTSWRYLQKERARAEDLIEDCRELNGVAEFEALVQRNVEMNAGLGYATFAAMVRFIATKEVEGVGLGVLEGDNAGSGTSSNEKVLFSDPRKQSRVMVAKQILSELVEEQEKIMAMVTLSNGMVDASGEEQAARDGLLHEIQLNKECLELINEASRRR